MRRSLSSYFPSFSWGIFTTSVFSFLIITGFSTFETANMPPPGLCPGGAGVIGGNVFTDYDFNGIDDDGGTGEEGIEIYIYESTGAGNESVLVDQTTSDINGDYYFNGLTDGVRYRVEFVVPASEQFLKSSPNGVDSRTSVQYPISPDCSVDFGLACPADFCGEEDKSSILAPCYISGDPLGGGSSAIGPGLVAVPYTASGMGQNSEILQIDATGMMWGLAYQKETKLIYGSSVLKRHSGFGPGGSGAIYVVESPDLGPGSVISTIDLDALGFDTGTDPRIMNPLPINKDEASHDIEAFSLVGKMSFGDMELSEDGKDLWVVNLFDKKLYKITIGNPYRQPTAADVSSLQIPDPGCSATGEYRPWAVKFYKGIIYVGIVCDASTSEDRDDLHAYIYSHDTNGAPNNWTNEVDFPLNFDRGYTFFTNPHIGNWNPWTDNYPQMLTNGTFQYPQPILSDIEFDVDGSMILGFLDRMSQQGGFQTYAPDLNSTTLYDTYSGGDIMKICKIGNDFVIEGDAGCTTAGSTNGQGRNGGEFYFTEEYPFPATGPALHQETALGGIAYRANSGEIASTAFDPLGDVNTGGLIWMDNTTGDRNNSYQIYDGSIGFAGKANGLGDLEIGCSAAPIEIGNYVWYDPNMDGIQDPGETPIPGVNVSLFSESGTELATVQTDANGEYYFNNEVLKASALTSDTMLQFNTDYFIVVGFNQYNTTTQILFDTLMLTIDSTGMGVDMNLNDSDAEIANGGAPTIFSGYPYTPVTTGSAGENDHTMDFGFFPEVNCVLTITANVTQDETCIGADDGIIEVTPDPAIPAEYSVNGGRTFSTQTTFTGLAAGTYYVVARELANPACRAQTILVIQPGRPVAPPTASVTQDETCDGADNGIITITPNMAVPSTFSVDGSAFSSQLVYGNLAPGMHTVTTRENANPLCKASITLTVDPAGPNTPPTAVVTQDETCVGADNGIITITPNVAIPSTFSINGGAFTTQTVYPNLAPGTYTITSSQNSIPACQASVLLTIQPATPLEPPTNVRGYELCLNSDVPAGFGLTADCVITCHADSLRQLTWWTAATGGMQVGSGSPFDPAETGAVDNSVLGTTTFYVQCHCGECVSERVPADFEIVPLPTPEIIGPNFVCPGDVSVFELVDKLGNDVFWSVASGGTILTQSDTTATVRWTMVQNAGPFTVTATETGINGCMGDATATVNVNSTAIACNDSIQISLDANGCAVVTPDQILEGTYNNFDIFDVQIEVSGVPIGNKVDCSHAGMNLKVNIKSDCDQNSCWSTIVVEDKLPPVINCPDPSDFVALDCTMDIDTVAPPTVVDNCGKSTLSMINEETTDPDDCDLVVIKRTWIATNDFGLQSAPCMQFITLTQPDAPQFPDDVTWTCEQYAAFPNIVEGVALHPYILENAGAIDLTAMQCTGAIGDDVAGIAPYEPNTKYWIDTEDLDVMLDPNYDDNYDNPDLDFDPACGTPTPEDDSAPEKYNTSILVGCPYIKECNITPNAHNPTIVKTPIYDNALPWDGLEDADILAMTGSGVPDLTNSYCKFAITFSDQKSEACAGADTTSVFKIFRTWNVFNWCTGETWTDLQIIKVIDKVAPTMTVEPIQAEATFSSYDGDVSTCTSTDFLPAPTVSDDCSEVFVQIITPVGEAIYTNGFDGTEGGRIPAPGLDFGTHTIQYIATDACGNRTETTATLEVVDYSVPTMICREFTDVSLSFDNWAKICAEDLDEGSHDNCGIDSFFIKKMNEPDSLFRECIQLNCGDSVFMAIVRAVDRSGNYNQCMVEVEVHDKLRPECRAPEDVWTTCDSIPRHYDLRDTSNLNKLFGTATFYDNCDATVEELAPAIDLDECGVGTIVRNWRATDPSGNRSSNRCRQTVMVQGNYDYKITFPADWTGACGDMETADSVVFETYACDQLAVDFEDLRFNISDDGACYKIIRTWTVLNWCSYDGTSQPIEVRNEPNGLMIFSEDDGAHGYYTYKQLIVVKDTEAPVITYDGDTEFCSTNTECDGLVEITPNSIDDACTNDLTVQWRLDADCNGSIESQGFNSFSKYVPIGKHCITYIVTDGCGNVATHTIDFEVKDCKKPTPICHNGLSADLDLDGEIEIWATDFDAGSFDYCNTTPLKFRANNVEDIDGNGFITADDYRVVVPTTSNIPLTCDDLGVQFVQMWVGDDYGNWDYCVTFVEVQDNMGFCGTNSKMGGKIATAQGKSVADVKVELSGDNSQSLMTDASGMFEFGNVALGGDYSVSPVKNDDHANGVSTFDIFQISQHILNVRRLDSPYKVIAADANRSGNVTTLDIVELRKVILRIQPEFTNNTSWRFVDKDYIFADANNPFAAGFPEVINHNNLASDELNANFVAVKIGDVNGDVETGNAQSVDGRTGNAPQIVSLENETLQPNEITTVRFNFDNVEDMLGYQFTLEFDPELIELENVIENDFIKENNFGFSLLNEGAITASWNNTGATPEDLYFELVFRASEDIELIDVLKINSRYTRAEAFNAAGELKNVELEFNTIEEVEADFNLHQNKPNPFSDGTLIGFDLPEASSATLTVFDLSGKVIQLINKDFPQGYNEIEITKDALNGAGVYYYRLETATDAATRKMMFLE